MRMLYTYRNKKVLYEMFFWYRRRYEVGTET